MLECSSVQDRGGLPAMMPASQSERGGKKVISRKRNMENLLGRHGVSNHIIRPGGCLKGPPIPASRSPRAPTCQVRPETVLLHSGKFG